MKKILSLILSVMVSFSLFLTKTVYASEFNQAHPEVITFSEKTTYGTAFKDFGALADTFYVSSWKGGVRQCKFEFSLYDYSGDNDWSLVEVYDPNGAPLKFVGTNSTIGVLHPGKNTFTLSGQLKEGNYKIYFTPTGNKSRLICTIYK